MDSQMDPADKMAIAKQLCTISHIVSSKNPSRKEMYEAARKLTLALESPEETMHRIAYLPLQLTIARIAGQLGLFEILVNSDVPSMTTKELAKLTKTDETLLKRILRYLSSVDMIKEADEDVYSPSSITKTLSRAGPMAGIQYNFDIVMPCCKSLPHLLESTQFQNPMESVICPSNLGRQTEIIPHDWLGDQLEQLEDFENLNKWMEVLREGHGTWLDVYPFQDIHCRDLILDTLLFVDISGGPGTQCRELRNKLPSPLGKIILQASTRSREQALELSRDGVELMIHDFLKPQPIKGARAYYLRNILRSHTDYKCVDILSQIIPAMTQSSVILIDDVVLPNRGTHRRAAQQDITMMLTMAAMQRTEKEWQALMLLAGLRIVKIYVYNGDARDGLIVAVPMDVEIGKGGEKDVVGRGGAMAGGEKKQYVWPGHGSRGQSARGEKKQHIWFFHDEDNL